MAGYQKKMAAAAGMKPFLLPESSLSAVEPPP